VMQDGRIHLYCTPNRGELYAFAQPAFAQPAFVRLLETG
jgi:hypothetical protein